MNGYKLTNSALSILFGLGVFSSSQIFAQTPATEQQPTIGDCSREFLVAYFPPSLVERALQNSNIPKDKWESITKGLTENEKNIVTQVEEKASKLTPNPLKDPQQRQVAVKIFRDTLLDIFSEVLKKNGITDEKQIQTMLDNIQQEKARKFADCLDKYKKMSTQQPANTGEAQKKDPLAEAAAPAVLSTDSKTETSSSGTSHSHFHESSENHSKDELEDYDDIF